jgi:hypothetical protein
MLLRYLQFVAVTLGLSMGVTAYAQDGWLLSAKPPLIIRYDDTPNYQFHFTNTSEKAIHGIKLHWTQDGNERSWVIVDTIRPHETVLVQVTALEKCCDLDKHYREATLTCDGYSSPIKIAQ